MTRPVTPAEAREMLDRATPGPWRVYGNAASEDALSDAWTISYDGDTLAELHADDRPEHGSESDESVAALCEADADLMAAAPALAETVASEPERIAAARNALRAEVAAALAAFVESDHSVNRALAAGDVRDEYHPTLFARLARLDALRGLLTPEVSP